MKSAILHLDSHMGYSTMKFVSRTQTRKNVISLFHLSF